MQVTPELIGNIGGEPIFSVPELGLHGLTVMGNLNSKGEIMSFSVLRFGHGEISKEQQDALLAEIKG